MDINKAFDLTGRTALVTGSSRGIGKSIAIALAQAGAKVAIHCRKTDDNLAQTLKEIREAGGTAEGVTGNLMDPDEVKALPGRVRDALGAIDILVLNASVQGYQTLEDFTMEEFERQYNVNMGSSFALIRGTLEHMKGQGWGRVLGIGSVNQWKQSPRLPIYASTKSALVNVIMGCARDHSGNGITFNNLAPGVIQTDRNREVLKDDAFKQKLLERIPCGFLGEPDDCAWLSLLLCSEAGRYITGADIPVTGGMHL